MFVDLEKIGKLGNKFEHLKKKGNLEKIVNLEFF